MTPAVQVVEARSARAAGRWSGSTGRVERGAELAYRAARAPAARAEDEYYVFQLVGLEVVEEGGRALGRVTDVVPGVANDVLELDTGLLLPLVEDCVRDVDLEAGRILVAPGFADPE